MFLCLGECPGTFLNFFINTFNMKAIILIIFALALGTAHPLPGQSTTAKGRVVQVSTQFVDLRELGKQRMWFVEANVAGKIHLMLLPLDCAIEPGDDITVVEGHGVPKHIFLKGCKYFDYMDKYLQKI